MKIIKALYVFHLVEDNRIAHHGRYHEHPDNEYEIHYFIEGDGHFLIDPKRYSINPNKAYLVAPHEFHSIIPEQNSRPISYFAIRFVMDDASTLFQELIALATRTGSLLNIKRSFRLYFDDIIHMYHFNTPVMKEAAEHLFQSLLLYICCTARNMKKSNEHPEGKTVSPLSSNLKIIHVKKAISMMQNTVEKNLQIRDIAAELNISYEYFIRIFQQEIKMPPAQYYKKLKISAASDLLISSTKSIKEIASKFDFADQFHFSHIFKKYIGISPVEYRKAFGRNRC